MHACARVYSVGLEPLFSLCQIFPRTARRTLFQSDYLGARWTKRKNTPRRGVIANLTRRFRGRKQATLNTRVTNGAGAYYRLPACESVLIREDCLTADIYAGHAKPWPLPFGGIIYSRDANLRMRMRAECRRAASAPRFPRGENAREGRGGGTQGDRVFYFGEARGTKPGIGTPRGKLEITRLPRRRAEFEGTCPAALAGIGSPEKYAPREDDAGLSRREDYVDELRPRSVCRHRLDVVRLPAKGAPSKPVTRFNPLQFFLLLVIVGPLSTINVRIELSWLLHIIKHCCKVPS